MRGLAGTIGERWTYTGAPAPTQVEMFDARRSVTERRRVDLKYVHWLGLPDDEVGPFLQRLELFDLRTLERERP